MQPARRTAGRMNADDVLVIANFCIFPIQRFNGSTSYVATARVLLRDISKILFPDNPVNLPIIKKTDSGPPLRLGFMRCCNRCVRIEPFPIVASRERSFAGQDKVSERKLRFC